ncbi:FAT2-like protein [Mya arenaria]|uniref:FAT2-like protein n=1 Tax=Mya arenaria TaxID=6604 RepID=A0ABY7FVS4_MYAAR|nr:FAT2-like protein [Mya arenaria]
MNENNPGFERSTFIAGIRGLSSRGHWTTEDLWRQTSILTLPPTICSINGTGSHTSLHEDTDSETLLHELQVCDYNYDRPSDLLEVGKVNGIEDNSTCWIEHVYDQWGENDMELFTLREDDPSYTNKWDCRLYKKECIVPSSPYKPPCGYKRENYTCPKHMGCMTHNVTQSYSVSIICRDGYGESDNRNFTFNVNSNQAPTYLNLPNEIIVDMNAASEHDIIFSTLYRDAENENLTYEYSFTKADDLSSVGYFKADPSGNYFGAITTTQTLPASYPSTTYSLNAFVTDKLSCTAYADLTITNLPDSVNIHEDEKTELTLFTVQTTDNNTDDSVTCLITNEEDNKPFFIEETYSGSDVWVVKNYVAGTNEERQLSAIKQTYTLNIDCHDTFGAGESKNLTITVTPNEGPTLTTLNTDGSLVEIKLRRNVSIVTENGRSDSIEVCVGDAKHPNHYCAHLNVTFNTDGDTSTGVVTLLRSLDFESLSKYTLTFTVNDGYLSSLQSYILVLNVTNVNEGNTITATKTSITFKETAKVGRIFDFGLQCLDEDHEEALTFSIIGGNHMDYFVLNTTNRKIYLAKEWDLEGSDNLPSTDSLTVQCEDAGGLSSTVELTFNIVDVNEHPPSVACTLPNGNTCPSTLSEMKFELKSDSSITDSLLTVTCAEPDGCNFDCVGNGLCKKYFRLVPKTTRKRSTGASSADLKLKQELDFNYNKEFVITIKISDLNDPPKFTGVSLLINYTATPPSPTPAVTSNCVTCSSQGRVLVGVLTVECIIAGLLVLHLTLVSPANIRRRALSNNGAKNATLNQRSSQIKAETTFSQRMERKTAYESSSSDSDSDSSSGTEVMAARPSPGRDNSR